jgi:pSer/pThr/pTyr-binding forkhead associated (FHA) protein
MIREKGMPIGILIKNPETSERVSFLIFPNQRIFVGRAATCEIYLLDDLLVKRHHCAIDSDKQDVYLAEDFGGEINPVLINGKVLRERRRLEDGDKITVGKTVLGFQKP